MFLTAQSLAIKSPAIRLCTLLLAALALASPPARAQEVFDPGPIKPDVPIPFSSTREFSAWIVYYYIAPDPDRITEALKFIIPRAKGATDPNIFLPAQRAIGLAMQSDPDRIPEWTAPLTDGHDPETDLFIATTAWHSDTTAGKALVDTLAQRHAPSAAPVDANRWRRLTNTHPLEYRDTPPSDGLTMDLLWSSFFATGDTSYLEPFLPLIASPEGSIPPLAEIDRSTIPGAALWSMTSNAYQHPRVLEFVKDQQGKVEDPALRKTLASIATQVYERTKADGPPTLPEPMRRVGSPRRESP